MDINYLDTETCGLHGLPVLLQYAKGTGPIELWNIWRNPIGETLDLIEDLYSDAICGFNLVFDCFQLTKLFTTFVMCPRDWYPEDHIDEIAELEERARFSNLCLKPKACLDLMLLARKGKYQSLMARDPITIRRVPTALAHRLVQELETQIQFDGIYFANAKDPNAPRWRIFDVKREDGTLNPELKDIKLRFRASGSLKNLARHAFKLAKPILFRDIEVDRKFWPKELGYAPFAKAVVWQNPGDVNEVDKWAGAWPDVIHHHIAHWGYNEKAREYAADDIVYTRRLHLEHFLDTNGLPAEPGDNDSELTAMVANCRWHGYAIDIPYLQKLREESFKRILDVPTAPHKVKIYITEALDAEERMGFTSTKKRVLESMTIEQEWKNPDGTLRPAAQRAHEVLEARKGKKRIELLDKLLLAKRLHAALKIIGALSSRMAGDHNLNVQGIDHDKNVRAAFPLADSKLEYISAATGIPISTVRDLYEIYVLCGGDFKSFEVSLAAAVFQDEKLNAFLKSGLKIHAIMAVHLFPGYTYEQILETDGRPNLYPEGDMYDKGKKGVFLIFYGGDENTLKNKLGIPIEIGVLALQWLRAEFPGIQRFQQRIISQFQALRQPGGIGTAVEWHEPKPYVESFLGFKRFFTLEHRVARILFDLAEKPPEEWKLVRIKVQRRAERIQTAVGAVRSALYGAAFGIISATVRQATNHEIQSPGAEITKAVQCAIWKLQPTGVSVFIVMPLNIHDEVMNPTRPGYESQVEEVVQHTVRSYHDRIPLLAIDWFNNIPNWASKKGQGGISGQEQGVQPSTRSTESLQPSH